MCFAASSPPINGHAGGGAAGETASGHNGGPTGGHGSGENGVMPSSTSSAIPATSPIAFFEFEQTDYECFEALVNYAYTGTSVLFRNFVFLIFKLLNKKVAREC